MKIISEIYTSKYYQLLIDNSGILRSMLNMGVRETIKQKKLTEEIMKNGFEKCLDDISKVIEDKTIDLNSILLLWCSLYSFYSLIMIPKLQDKFINVTNWYKKVLVDNNISNLVEKYGISCRLCGEARPNSVQIDLLPDPIAVGKLADKSVALNEGYKKKIEKRKADPVPAPVEKKPVELPKLTSLNEPVTHENPENDQEKKVFELLDNLSISHISFINKYY